MLERFAPAVNSLKTLAELATRLPGAAVGGVPGAVRAVARRRPDAPTLLLWAAEDELDRARDLVRNLPNPTGG